MCWSARRRARDLFDGKHNVSWLGGYGYRYAHPTSFVIFRHAARQSEVKLCKAGFSSGSHELQRTKSGPVPGQSVKDNALAEMSTIRPYTQNFVIRSQLRRCCYYFQFCGSTFDAVGPKFLVNLKKSSSNKRARTRWESHFRGTNGDQHRFTA